MANATPPNFSVLDTPATSFTNPPLNQILNQLTTVKLDRSNYLLWKTLALPILKGYKLEGHLTGEKPCPEKFVTITSSAGSNGSITEEGDDREQRAPKQIASSSMSAPAIINPLFEQWITTDLLLLGWLYNSMTPKVVVQLMGFTNAKDLS